MVWVKCKARANIENTQSQQPARRMAFLVVFTHPAGVCESSSGCGTHVAAIVMVIVAFIVSRNNIVSMGSGGPFQSRVCVGGLAARQSGGGKAFNLETG